MNDEQLLRYSRHILLDEIGIEGQQRLLDSTVLVVGAGGLGSPAALYLAAAGVGRLLLADGDTVDLTNLQRQILHRQDRIGMAKTASAALTLNALNPEVQIVPLPRLDTDHESDDGDATADASAHAGTRHADGASASIDTRRTDTSPEDRVTTARNQPTPSVRTFDDAVQQADVVLDCSDNFATRTPSTAPASPTANPWSPAPPSASTASSPSSTSASPTPPATNACFPTAKASRKPAAARWASLPPSPASSAPCRPPKP